MLELDAYVELQAAGMAEGVAAAVTCPHTDTCFGILTDDGLACKCKVRSTVGWVDEWGVGMEDGNKRVGGGVCR